MPAAHGNSLTNRPFIRTKPSVLQHVKSVAEATGGHAAPGKIYKEAVRNVTTADPSVNSKSLKGIHCTD